MTDAETTVNSKAPANWPDLPNVAAKGISYFTSAQVPAAGTAIENGKPIPKLFQPITIRGVTFQNRIWVSPMCQYSAQDGHLTDWHMAHLGGIISRGPGLTMIEATAVVPEGRISPEDSGIWADSHVAPLKRIVEFAHSQNQKIGIQLAHAGRKASTTAPWISRKAIATKNVGGWPDNIYGPSPIPFDVDSPQPHEMTIEDIENLKKNWAAAVRRSVEAGFDVIEIHGAHGYLIHEFYSPYSNHRTDKYGGSFENRIRLLLEIIDITKANAKPETLIFIRFSASDWLEYDTSVESWKSEDTVKLTQVIAKTGKVDLFDISSAANSPKQKIESAPGYQSKFSKAVKQGLAAVGENVATSVVGIINTGELANSLLEDGSADVVFVGRPFQKNPALVWQWAEELGLEVRAANQIGWGFGQKIGGGVRHHSTARL
ncbi:hypothetical protein H072_10184 [Dactylellina haptotyla CBS 200.50]|uniref:NADH:flavin oxidoreductase/NADH oxidase N-terminal domain-containing protein n=1 Tax=Dactylellina haptotyla (strain CBS 200.50) TaxID=1284197 RepID=S7ZZZ6_DACHA|nr:hypothetical protein H072_10184 [Dactylellina haptotyla CBS 200.50]